MKQFLILNGPNINLTGLREKSVYGAKTFDDLMAEIRREAERLGCGVRFVQSNHEGALIDALQQAYFDGLDGVVFNPGGYTHTSVAILDALKAVSIPAVEVHISDVDAREPFRQISYAGMACCKTIKGHGFQGYREAIQYLVEQYG